MPQPLQVALVGYLNTLPLEFGLRRLCDDGSLNLLLDTPARCAAHFAEGRVDLALVPVGALDSLTDYEICLDYCIGCDGPVRTVCILSHQALAHCDTLYLDRHSRSSRLLAQLYCQHKGISLRYQDQRISQLGTLGPHEAALMIGDKVFEQEKNFAHIVDLGQAWKEWTGMPFVFAVWIKRAGLEIDSAALNAALALGLAQTEKLVKAHAATSHLPLADIDSYIHVNLKYAFGPDQKAALNHFRSLVASHNLS